MLRGDSGVEIPQPLHRFLESRLFAGHGNSVRHRRQGQLQREWTAYALVALRGLLDAFGGDRLVDRLAERLTQIVDDRPTQVGNSDGGVS